MLTDSKTNDNTPAPNSHSGQRPRLVLKKSKTKLIKMERNSSLNRAEVALLIRKICDEKGIEYPNKIPRSSFV